MTIQRMDNVLIVVDDLEAAKAFFAELGMELEGEAQVEGPWVDRTVGLDDVRADIAMMRTPDGHGRVELTKFHTPPAIRSTIPTSRSWSGAPQLSPLRSRKRIVSASATRLLPSGSGWLRASRSISTAAWSSRPL